MSAVFKERACQPCFHGDVHVELNFRFTRLCSPNEDLEGGTKDEIQIFEALFKGVSTRFGLRTLEKSVENLDFIFCSSFQIFVWGA